MLRCRLLMVLVAILLGLLIGTNLRWSREYQRLQERYQYIESENAKNETFQQAG